MFYVVYAAYFNSGHGKILGAFSSGYLILQVLLTFCFPVPLLLASLLFSQASNVMNSYWYG